MLSHGLPSPVTVSIAGITNLLQAKMLLSLQSEAKGMAHASQSGRDNDGQCQAQYLMDYLDSTLAPKERNESSGQRLDRFWKCTTFEFRYTACAM